MSPESYFYVASNDERVGTSKNEMFAPARRINTALKTTVVLESRELVELCDRRARRFVEPFLDPARRHCIDVSSSLSRLLPVD